MIVGLEEDTLSGEKIGNLVTRGMGKMPGDVYIPKVKMQPSDAGLMRGPA